MTNLPKHVNPSTLEEYKNHRSFSIAETLIYQMRIFCCSLEEAWNHHIHPAVHRSHNKDEVMFIANLILEKQKKTKLVYNPKNETGYQCYLDEYDLLIRCTFFEAGKYYLDIYNKDMERLYHHPSPIVYPFGTVKTLLRKKFGIRRIVLKWIEF